MEQQMPQQQEESAEQEPDRSVGGEARYGRRAIVLGVAAAGATVVAALSAGEKPADAANGDAVKLGEGNSASASTQITTSDGNGLSALTLGDSAIGVYGFSAASGGGTGVEGDSNYGTGVIGVTEENGQSGVHGKDVSASGGYGVSGRSDNGIGVYCQGATALQVDGVAGFSRSGIAVVAGSVAKPEKRVTVSGIDLSATSLIFVTPQGHVGGVAVEAAVPDVASSSFTIYLTDVVTISLPMAWFVVG